MIGFKINYYTNFIKVYIFTFRWLYKNLFYILNDLEVFIFYGSISDLKVNLDEAKAIWQFGLVLLKTIKEKRGKRKHKFLDNNTCIVYFISAIV